ncbi:MAG TPA: hypothetical protein VM370_11350 [Candidatus Thermoplasmatota archaeon]|nr:hypothetical protein [Candidatus Thermoplasmatota archaeon]
MDGRSYTLLIALAFVGTGLTGCIQNPDWLNTSSSEVSARDNLRDADKAALDWSPNARLVGVMAFELAESPDPRIDADPDPGNGLAPAWWYVYCDAAAEKAEAEASTFRSDDNEEKAMAAMQMSLRAFKVTSDGEVTSEKDAEAMAAGMDHSMAQPLGEWSVDSDEALAAAKADEGFAKVANGFNASIVEGIAQIEGADAWWVSAMSADGFVVASVDAVTGELLDVQTMDQDFSMPTFEWGAANPELSGTPVYLEGEGSAAAADEAIEVPFWSSGPMHGTMMVTYATSAPMDGLHWAILDSEGEYVTGDHLSNWEGGEGEYEMELEIEDAGDYVLSIGYMSSFPGPNFLPVPTPLGGSVDYSYVLDLMPGEMPDEDDS